MIGGLGQRLVAVVVAVQLIAGVGALGVVDGDTAGPTTPGPAPSARAAETTDPTAGDGSSPPADGPAAPAVSGSAAATPPGATADAGAPAATVPPRPPTRLLMVEGEPGPVSAHRRAQFDSQPPEFQPRHIGTEFEIEGTLSTGTAWRVTYTRRGSAPTLCMERAEAGDDGTGWSGGCDYDAGFDHSAGSRGSSPHTMWFGVVDRSAARVEIRASDGAAGDMHLVDAEPIGVNAFVGFVDCREDVTELVAYDVAGGVLGREPLTGADFLRCDESGKRKGL